MQTNSTTPKEQLNPTSWALEYFHHSSYVQGFKIKKSLLNIQSAYQKIEVLDTEAVGKLLLLDGKTMISEADEFVYHELMAHIPWMTVKNCESVLIIGGGDGGIVREFCKHSSIKKIFLVEIDQLVVKVCQDFFPECTSGLSDPRVQIVHQDGHEFLKKTIHKFDVVVVDSTDPENFASTLFTEEFYGTVKNVLNPGGIMMAQTENPFLDTFNMKNIYANLRSQFSEVHSLSAPLLIYPGVFWTFAFCSNGVKPQELIEEKLANMKELEKNLKWYNHLWHVGAFAISNFHKKVIKQL